MNYLTQALRIIGDPANWAQATGIGQRLMDHVAYSAVAVIIATVIAVPVGLWLGHTRRLATTVVAAAGALRALPSLGLLTWLTLELSFGVRLPVIPALVVLVILAIPPVLASTTSGVAQLPREVIDSARASGFAESHIVTAVELPLAAPTIIGGIRSASVQVIATATIVAYIGLSGLGRYLIDGLALQDYPQMLVGALLVAAVALVADIALAVCQKLAQPKGLA